MIYYILISIFIILVESGVIAFLILLLLRKRQRAIQDYNKKITEREIMLNKIDKKSETKKKEVENEIKKAKTIDDFINIFSKL